VIGADEAWYIRMKFMTLGLGMYLRKKRRSDG